MLKLMRLEMKKVNIKNYIMAAIIANVVIISILSIIFIGIHNESKVIVQYPNFIFSLVESIVKATFIVFASTLISKLVIEEYRDKTISLLFMYPVNRKKIIVSKLVLIAIFTFICLLVSTIFIESVIYVSNNFVKFVAFNVEMPFTYNNLIEILFSSLASAGTSLISLFFGMIRKSVAATIVSSILMVTIICSNGGGLSLSSIVGVQIALFITGIIIAYSTIVNIEHVDV